MSKSTTATDCPRLIPSRARVIRRLQLGQPLTHDISMTDLKYLSAILRDLRRSGLIDDDHRLTESGQNWRGEVKP